MKKALIAGAASVALAAMPVVSTFATEVSTPRTDKLVLTIADQCTLSRDTVSSHTIGSNDGIAASPAAAWSTGEEVTGPSSYSQMDTFTATLLPGLAYDNIATSKFNVACNHSTGYKVTVAASSFTSNPSVTGAQTWPYNVGSQSAGYAATGSSWYLTSNGTGSSSIIDPSSPTNNVVLGESIETTKTEFTINYNVKVDSAQKVGTYEATAVYTLAENA